LTLNCVPSISDMPRRINSLRSAASRGKLAQYQGTLR
jgi:hypothetical protein